MSKIMSVIASIAVLLIFLAQTNKSEATSIKSDILATNKVLKSYNLALESLNIKDVYGLFTNDSQIYETGGNEGNFENYAKHHLEPELKNFKSLKFSKYKVETKVDLPYAFSTETYFLSLVLKNSKRVEKTINIKGLATSILKKIDGQWKIIKYHSSGKIIPNKANTKNDKRDKHNKHSGH